MAASRTDVTVAETPEVTVTPAADVATRIERAAALARLTAPVLVPEVPRDRDDDDWHGALFAPQTVPVIPKSTIFTGITHTWANTGEPYRVIESAFPCVVGGVYKVATFGDVVIIDAETAQFGLRYASIEPID
jgi:hypothetical protein